MASCRFQQERVIHKQNNTKGISLTISLKERGCISGQTEEATRASGKLDSGMGTAYIGKMNLSMKDGSRRIDTTATVD